MIPIDPTLSDRTGQFDEACWAYVRGERPTMPTAQEFRLHPYVADSHARLIADIASQRQQREAVKEYNAQKELL